MNTEPRCAWITWEKQIRNRSLSREFNARFYEFDYNISLTYRYIKSLIKTFFVLCENRNGIVFVQNPSVVLTLFAVILKPVLRYVLIVDAHNSAIFPRQRWLRKITPFIIRHSDFTIVTNENLSNIISTSGGNPLILPDPLPVFKNIEFLRNLNIEAHKVFFICSWADDEPYLEVFKAAEKLPKYTFFVTGKSKGKELEYGKSLPENVVLTGYLPDNEYHEMLATSAIILDLTTRENCLVCGAYEATALERPFLVSDKQAIKDYFKAGCMYVENSASGIISGIDQMSKNYLLLKHDIERARLTMGNEWAALYEEAKDRIFKKFFR